MLALADAVDASHRALIPTVQAIRAPVGSWASRKCLPFGHHDAGSAQSRRDGAPMSEWREEKNRRALARLQKALPEDFPAPVLINALARPLTPAMPRRAVDLYWRAHPLRADKLARALAARSGGPAGWTWALGTGRPAGRLP